LKALIYFWRKECREDSGCIKLIEEDGWYQVRTKGSHHQCKQPKKVGRVTIAGHPNDDLAPGTLNSILKQAKLKEMK
jgi:predicted RNA binding protein YcfA (HicA-like mRNA interferase family)